MRILGEFNLTGLPSAYHTSWDNAEKLLQLGGVSVDPFYPTKWLTISLTGSTRHTVSFKGNSGACDCLAFQNIGLCPHIISSAYLKGNLSALIAAFQPPLKSICSTSKSATAGKKEHEKANKRQRRPYERDVSTYENPLVQDEETSVSTKLHIAFIQDNASEGCYGCKKKWRPSGCRSGHVPPVPQDMILTRKERRCWKKDGKLRIDTWPTNVYYHAAESCLKKNKATGIRNIFVTELDKLRLEKAHLIILKREFGLSL